MKLNLKNMLQLFVVLFALILTAKAIAILTWLFLISILGRLFPNLSWSSEIGWVTGSILALTFTYYVSFKSDLFKKIQTKQSP